MEYYINPSLFSGNKYIAIIKLTFLETENKGDTDCHCNMAYIYIYGFPRWRKW